MRKFLLVALLIFIAGCISTNVQRLDQEDRPARSPEAVTVLLEEPQQPYSVVAIVEAKSKTVFDGFKKLRNEVVAEAASMGGEAVILGAEKTKTEFVFTGPTMIQSDKRHLTGAVIVFD